MTHPCCMHCVHSAGTRAGHANPCAMCDMDAGLLAWRRSVRAEYAPAVHPASPVRDPSLPHQIVILLHGNGKIGVSCNCRYVPHGGRQPYTPFESRRRWEPDEILACYKEHLPPEGAQQ